MKNALLGALTAFGLVWAWKKFNISEKIAPIVERGREWASEKLSACGKDKTEPDPNPEEK